MKIWLCHLTIRHAYLHYLGPRAGDRRQQTIITPLTGTPLEATTVVAVPEVDGGAASSVKRSILLSMSYVYIIFLVHQHVNALENSAI
jgi:hypothetical protein